MRGRIFMREIFHMETFYRNKFTDKSKLNNLKFSHFSISVFRPRNTKHEIEKPDGRCRTIKRRRDDRRKK